ncbi:MAG: helix-hairpin-helix domain-containing protein [Thermoanaerobaculia bacterium]
MAYLLRLRVLRLSFDGQAGGSITWQRAGETFETLPPEPFGRALVEADALAMLAGGVARWLYQPLALSAQHIRGDDRRAESYLYAARGDRFVIPHWREYLRQRALAMLTPAENQAAIALLAGRFADGVEIRPADLYREVDDAFSFARTRLDIVRLSRKGGFGPSYSETMALPYFVTHWGMDLFSRRISELGLPIHINGKLLAAGIEEIGQLLLRSRRELSELPGISRATVRQIVRELDLWVLLLAPDASAPADPAAPSWLSAAHVYRREVGEAIYDPSHSPRFYQV